MKENQKLLSKLPKMDVLLQSDVASAHLPLLGHQAVLDICRKAVEEAKNSALTDGVEPNLENIKKSVSDGCRRGRSKVLSKVINGTGVLLHTNLGRAPLGPAIFEAMAKTAGGYCNVEIDVLERKRGVRAPHVSSMLAQLCGAEDAVVVNNNAAALFLILGEFASNKEVLVSRSELVQIGGGFRIPDILRSSGATLREVGTTNITSMDDYTDALCDNSAMVLKVHQSNFKMEGFVEAPEVRDLAKVDLKGAILVSDLGSGNMVRHIAGIKITEPTPEDMLSQGADLVCFSCDKMLGGVQGGAIAGKKELIARLKKNPIMRVLRGDKMMYAALQIILTHHLAGDSNKVQLWAMASAKKTDIKNRIEAFIKKNNLPQQKFKIADCQSTFGGGTTPGESIPSAALQINDNKSADKIARLFQKTEPAVIGTVKEGTFQLDFRTILPQDEPDLARIIKEGF